MMSEIPVLQDWDSLKPRDLKRLGKQLARELPPGWQFLRMESHPANGVVRHVAVFQWEATEFALIPGGSVMLGYDPNNPPNLSDEDMDSWREASRSEYKGINWDTFVEGHMTPIRRAKLEPLLMEVVADRTYRTPVSNPEGRIITNWVSDPKTVGKIRRLVNQNGFRLPTSDEWEHACRAGTRSFWWWGDSCGEPPLRNQFALDIARNSGHHEWCTEPDVFRGGDGGCVFCAGVGGYFGVQHSLASACYFPFAKADKSRAKFWGWVRRVFPLGLECRFGGSSP
jgi:hypothetical protein